MAAISYLGSLLVVLVVIQTSKATIGYSTNVADVVFVCETADSDYSNRGRRGDILFMVYFLNRANLSLAQVGLVVAQNQSVTDEIELSFHNNRGALYDGISQSTPREDSVGTDLYAALQKADDMIDQDGRSNADKHIVLITRGKNVDNEDDLISLANSIKGNGTRISILYGAGKETDFYDDMVTTLPIDYADLISGDEAEDLMDNVWGVEGTK